MMPLLTWLIDLNASVADPHQHPAFGELMALAHRDDLDAMIAVCQRTGLLPDLDLGQVKRTVALYEAGARAGDDYRPPAARLPVTFFAADRAEGEEVSLGWRDLLGKNLEVVKIGGTHLSMVRPPLAGKLAQQMAHRMQLHAPGLAYTAATH